MRQRHVHLCGRDSACCETHAKADAANGNRPVSSMHWPYSTAAYTVCNTISLFRGIRWQGWGSPPDVGVGEGLGGVGNLSQDLAGVAAAEHGQLVHRPVPAIADTPVRPLPRYFACDRGPAESYPQLRRLSLPHSHYSPLRGIWYYKLPKGGMHVATLHQTLAKVGAAHKSQRIQVASKAFSMLGSPDMLHTCCRSSCKVLSHRNGWWSRSSRRRARRRRTPELGSIPA